MLLGMPAFQITAKLGWHLEIVCKDGRSAVQCLVSGYTGICDIGMFPCVIATD